MDAMTMQQACAPTRPHVGGPHRDQYDDSTPCTEWDVRALLNHLLGTLELGRLCSRTPRPRRHGTGELPPTDLVGDDPLKAYRVGVEALLAAADDDAFDRLHATPFGDMPGAVLAGFTTLDIPVHGWDLARATGQTRDARRRPRRGRSSPSPARPSPTTCARRASGRRSLSPRTRRRPIDSSPSSAGRP